MIDNLRFEGMHSIQGLKLYDLLTKTLTFQYWLGLQHHLIFKRTDNKQLSNCPKIDHEKRIKREYGDSSQVHI